VEVGQARGTGVTAGRWQGWVERFDRRGDDHYAHGQEGVVRELRDKRGNPLGDWLHATAKEHQLGPVTYFWPRPGSTEILQKVALVTRVGDQGCTVVGYYRPAHRGKEMIP
jgi:hypothetical protein